ncbi:MAG TPA: hypothetical protein VK806_02605 [Bacteroidia bacterium]|nr:hypothetical protein [Bacteroidia bacterium]
MIKHLVLLFSLVGLFFSQFFLQSNITVTQTAPPTASANSSFVVQVTIDKGAVSGFAKFQEDFPQGFTAEAVDKHGATVLSSGNAIKFIWASLPSDQSITISIKVTVDGTVSGTQTFGGKFLYVINNEKQEADASPSSVTISAGAVASTTPANTTQPDNSTAASNNTTPANTATTTPANTTTTQPDNSTAASNNTTPANTSTTTPTNTATTTQPDNSTAASNTTTPANTTTAPVNNTTTAPANTTAATTSAPAPFVNGVSVSRSYSSSSVAPGGNITVSVTIHKGSLSGFAKLEEIMPAGITPTEGNKQSASFTVVDNKLKMVWLSLPSDSVFTVTYTITAGASLSGDQTITGTFSYVMNDAATKYPIAGLTFTVGAAVASNNQNSNVQVNNTQVNSTQANNTQANNTQVNSTQANNTQTNNTQVANNTQVNNTQSNNTQANNNQTTSADVTPHISGGQGVMYRVQIMALQHAVSTAYFGKHYSMRDKVYTEMIDGLTKYTVGKFSDYKSVHDRREEIKGMGVAGPFVVAYNGGKRVTVQEALMITKQQWYQ